MRSLLSLLPYLRPRRRTMILGLVLVVASTVPTLIIYRIIGQAIDGTLRGIPLERVALLAGLMVVLVLVGGALKYWMRECLNGLSRWVEYDVRNALFAHLEQLDAAYY